MRILQMLCVLRAEYAVNLSTCRTRFADHATSLRFGRVLSADCKNEETVICGQGDV